MAPFKPSSLNWPCHFFRTETLYGFLASAKMCRPHPSYAPRFFVLFTKKKIIQYVVLSITLLLCIFVIFFIKTPFWNMNSKCLPDF